MIERILVVLDKFWATIGNLFIWYLLGRVQKC